MQTPIAESELILNPDGSVYHLHLLPEQIANTIITVGDPDRVGEVSKYFDKIEYKIQKREFITHTGYIGNKRLTVISTGIGTDNIDILMNELDALVNIDLHTRMPKEQLTQLDFVRIGTSGCLDENLPLDSFLVSDYGLGLEGVLLFYDILQNESEKGLEVALAKHLDANNFHFPITPVGTQASAFWVDTFKEFYHGITLTATGFYAPQNRQLRAPSRIHDLFSVVESFRYNDLKITNFEMETAGIYGLANTLGHRAVSLNVLIAQRKTGKFSPDPYKSVEKLIQYTLEKIAAL